MSCGRGAVPAVKKCAVKLLRQFVAQLRARPDLGHDRALGDEISRASPEPDEEVCARGEFDQVLVCDRLDVAAMPGKKRACFAFKLRRQLAPASARAFARALLRLFRIEAIEPGLQLFRDAADDGLGQDGGRDVMDEINQEPDTGDTQEQAAGDREKRDKADRVRPANRPQNEQAIEEGGNKNPEHDLGAAVVHEIAQEARPELRRSKRERDDGDGKNHARDRDGGTGDGGEHAARAFRPARPDPARGPGPFRFDQGIEMDGEEGEAGRGRGHEGWDEPIAAAQTLPEGAKERVHRPLYPCLALAKRDSPPAFLCASFPPR